MPTIPERLNSLERQSEECRRTNQVVGRIYDAVAGEEGLDGARHGGILGQLGSVEGRLGGVEAKLANGGLRAHLGVKEWVALFSALGTGMAAALIGLIR